MKIKLLLSGSEGKMGIAIAEALRNQNLGEVVAELDIGIDINDLAAKGANVIIDFSHHSLTKNLLTFALQNKLPVIIGTTGHDVSELEAIEKAAAQIPIVFAPNFSVGVNTLFWLVEKAVAILDESYDIEVVEMHHRHKLDAPSGTARKLAEILADGRRLSYEKNTAHGRVGEVGARKHDEIGMHSMRGGDVVGDHTVTFAAEGERLELAHKASSRQTFAGGAVRAAAWLLENNAKEGLFSMRDVLKLS